MRDYSPEKKKLIHSFHPRYTHTHNPACVRLWLAVRRRPVPNQYYRGCTELVGVCRRKKQRRLADQRRTKSSRPNSTAAAASSAVLDVLLLKNEKITHTHTQCGRDRDDAAITVCRVLVTVAGRSPVSVEPEELVPTPVVVASFAWFCAVCFSRTQASDFWWLAWWRAVGFFGEDGGRRGRR